MTLTSIAKSETTRRGAVAPRTGVWKWLIRPVHHRAVRELRLAVERDDAARLASLLDPGIAVVVDSGEKRHPAIRVVRGVGDATALLLHGMAVERGVTIAECAINGQAGLTVNRGGEVVAAMNVDFTGRLISVIWVRLRPEMLRHWNQI